MSKVFAAKRDIIVMIPKGKVAEVEQEEAYVAEQEAAGNKSLTYYWQMGRLPREQPRRIYFVWDGAIRAWHEVIGMDREAGAIYMSTKINELSEPIPMDSFRGFRYYEEK